MIANNETEGYSVDSHENTTFFCCLDCYNQERPRTKKMCSPNKLHTWGTALDRAGHGLKSFAFKPDEITTSTLIFIFSSAELANRTDISFFHSRPEHFLTAYVAWPKRFLSKLFPSKDPPSPRNLDPS